MSDEVYEYKEPKLNASRTVEWTFLGIPFYSHTQQMSKEDAEEEIKKGKFKTAHKLAVETYLKPRLKRVI
jgi:hypothetical protein